MNKKIISTTWAWALLLGSLLYFQNNWPENEEVNTTLDSTKKQISKTIGNQKKYQTNKIENDLINTEDTMKSNEGNDIEYELLKKQWLDALNEMEKSFLDSLKKETLRNSSFELNWLKYNQYYKWDNLIIENSFWETLLILPSWILHTNFKYNIRWIDYVRVGYNIENNVRETWLTDLDNWEIIYKWYNIQEDWITVNWIKYHFSKRSLEFDPYSSKYLKSLTNGSNFLINLENWFELFEGMGLEKIKRVIGSDYIQARQTETWNRVLVDFNTNEILLEEYNIRFITKITSDDKDTWVNVVLKDWNNWIIILETWELIITKKTED